MGNKVSVLQRKRANETNYKYGSLYEGMENKSRLNKELFLRRKDKEDIERKEGETSMNNNDKIERKNNVEIQERLNEENKNKMFNEKNVLIFGTESSGKSTIIKAMKINNGDGLKTDQCQEAKYHIRRNIISSIITLLYESERLYKNNIIHKSVDLNNPKLVAAIQCICSYKHESFENEEHFDGKKMEKLINALDILWNLESIQLTFAEHGRFVFADNMDYFFNKMTSIFMNSYNPTKEDILRGTIKTKKIQKYAFNRNDWSHTINIYDISEQHNNYKKWIHSFQNVTVIIFVAALNHFNHISYKDENVNAMKESIFLFGDIINSKWFKTTEVILLLNKKDLFSKALRNGSSLSQYFNIQCGWNGAQWQQEQNDNVDIDLNTECKEEIDFIKSIYLSYNKNPERKIFVHITDGINDQHLKEMIFDDIQNICIRSNIKKTSLMI